MKDFQEILKGLSEPLTISDIDFRAQSISEKGWVTILAYKDARVDMKRLDQEAGPYWQRKHEVINDNLFCSIGIYDKETGQWVWRQDVGTESNTEKEKGQSSDSFKRAGFNWGIGRELYDYPIIKLQLAKEEFTTKNVGNGKVVGQTYEKFSDWKWQIHRQVDGSLRVIASKGKQVRYDSAVGMFDNTIEKHGKQLPTLIDDTLIEKACENIKSGRFKFEKAIAALQRNYTINQDVLEKLEESRPK